MGVEAAPATWKVEAAPNHQTRSSLTLLEKVDPVVPDRVADWRFTDDDVTVAIETRGDWIDYSVTVMAAAEGSHLYIP